MNIMYVLQIDFKIHFLFNGTYLNYRNHFVSRMSVQKILKLLGQPTFKIVW